MEEIKMKHLCYTVLVIIAIIALISAIYIVRPGYCGVLVTLGNVSDRTYGNGVGLKCPFISSMKKMDVRTTTYSAEASTYTADIQPAAIKYTLTYNIRQDNANVLYRKVGTEYTKKLITPVINDVLKDVIGKWQAQELVANRDKARQQVLDLLKERLNKDFFENVSFQIINLDYSDNFEKAIENKVIAEQKAQEAINNTKRIKEESEQKVIAAQAESEAMRIKTEALARDKSLIDYEAVQKWDGKLPTYMMGNSVPFINLK